MKGTGKEIRLGSIIDVNGSYYCNGVVRLEDGLWSIWDNTEQLRLLSDDEIKDGIKGVFVDGMCVLVKCEKGENLKEKDMSLLMDFVVSSYFVKLDANDKGSVLVRRS
jgi:hypothetical protein